MRTGRILRSSEIKINSILKKEKCAWQSSRLENCTSISDTWRTVKNWLGWKTGGPPTKLVIEGELKSKPKELADCMNNFFVNKVTNLRNTIPPCRQDPLHRVKEIMKNRTCSFKLESVHPDEIKEIINNMKNSKSCGLDNIDSFVFKLASDELTPSITPIVNLSITRNNCHSPTQPQLNSSWE